MNLLTAAVFGLSLQARSAPVEAREETLPGDSAFVLGTGGSGVKVRSGPGPSHSVVGAVSEETLVRIVNGPKSDDDKHWCEIRATDGEGGRVRGWVAGMFLVSPERVKVGEDGSLGTRSFTAKVTSYASGHGGVGYYTATGTRVRWGTVAVDPRFIPLGSLMTIDGLDGVFTAEDTGGGVRGAMVDVWFPDLDSAMRWNSQNQRRTVRILREGS